MKLRLSFSYIFSPTNYTYFGTFNENFIMDFSAMTVSNSVGSQCSRYTLDDKTFISDTNRYSSSTPRRHVFWALTNLLLNYYL